MWPVRGAWPEVVASRIDSLVVDSLDLDRSGSARQAAGMTQEASEFCPSVRPSALSTAVSSRRTNS